MPCHHAVTDKNVVIEPELNVESALKFLKKNKIATACVVDSDGKLLGLFSEKILLQNLIPVSVVMSDGVHMDVKVGAAPGVAKRLSKTKLLPVSELSDRKYISVDPDAPLWEAVSLITRHGGPLAVIDRNDKFFGLITYATLIEALDQMGASDA